MAKQKNYRNNGITFRKAASTPFSIGDFIEADGNGTFVPATGTQQLHGISNQAVSSSDADYALETPINVTEGGTNIVFEIPVSIGSATNALEGTYVDVDPASPGAVDVTTSTLGQIFVVKVLSGDTILGKIAQIECCVS